VKELDASEDLKSNLEIDIQEMTDDHIKKIESILAKKEEEIMTV